MIHKAVTATILAAFAISSSASAAEITLMGGVVPRPTDSRMVPPGAFHKEGLWKIGMSHFGVEANTWATQMAHEAEAAAKADRRIATFVLLDAKLSQAQQTSDIDALIAQKVDAIVVTPVTSTSADVGIQKAVAAGIPVIVHTGQTETDAFTVDIQGGGRNFGKVMGDFLVQQLGGKGSIWVLRGLPTHPEDGARYNGLLDAIKGTDVKIVAEDAGLWNYDYGHKVCETFLLEAPKADGIWSSGADMTRACMDVFHEYGASLPPISGEGNNGYFAKWIETGATSIAAEYSPEQGAAGIRAATTLLDGQSLHKRYIYEPDGWSLEKAKANFREDLNDKAWLPTGLGDDELRRLYGKP